MVGVQFSKLNARRFPQVLTERSRFGVNPPHNADGRAAGLGKVHAGRTACRHPAAAHAAELLEVSMIHSIAGQFSGGPLSDRSTPSTLLRLDTPRELLNDCGLGAALRV